MLHRIIILILLACTTLKCPAQEWGVETETFAIPEDFDRNDPTAAKRLMDDMILRRNIAINRYLLPLTKVLVESDSIQSIEIVDSQVKDITEVVKGFESKCESDSIQSIEIVDSQVKDITEVVKGFESKCESLKATLPADDPNLTREIAKAKENATMQISKILIEFQSKEIFEWKPDKIGILKIAARTPVGEAIGLSETQKEKIADDANQLSESMQAELLEMREKAYQIYLTRLTNDQRTRLMEIYGEKTIKSKFFDSPIETLIPQLTFDTQGDNSPKKED